MLSANLYHRSFFSELTRSRIPLPPPLPCASFCRRAECYYEEKSAGRFLESFKKKFASQELASLQERTGPQPKGGPAPCICLVALSPESEGGEDDESGSEDGVSHIVGTLDVRRASLNDAKGGNWAALLKWGEDAATPDTAGPPQPLVADGAPLSALSDLGATTCYIANVCTALGARRRGVARRLLSEASQAAAGWGFTGVFTSVERDNSPARGLYAACGFEEVSDAALIAKVEKVFGKPEGATLILYAPLPLVHTSRRHGAA